MSSLGMLSGPGALLLERFFRAVSFTCRVSLLDMSVPCFGCGGGSIGSGLEGSSHGMSCVRLLSGTENFYGRSSLICLCTSCFMPLGSMYTLPCVGSRTAVKVGGAIVLFQMERFALLRFL